MTVKERAREKKEAILSTLYGQYFVFFISIRLGLNED